MLTGDNEAGVISSLFHDERRRKDSSSDFKRHTEPEALKRPTIENNSGDSRTLRQTHGGDNDEDEEKAHCF